MKPSLRDKRFRFRPNHFGAFFLAMTLVQMITACSSAAPTVVDRKKSSGADGEMSNRTDDQNSEKPYGSSTGSGTSDGSVTGTTTTQPATKESEAATIPGTVTGSPGNEKEAEPGQILRNGVYLIKSQYSKKCIRVPDSKREDFVKLVQSDCDSDVPADVKWRIDYVEHKYYRFTNLANGKSIQIMNQSAENEALIEQASYLGEPYQMWDLAKNADNTFSIKPRDVATLCLDVANGSLSNNTPLQLWKDCGGVGQKWLINPIY